MISDNYSLSADLLVLLRSNVEADYYKALNLLMTTPSVKEAIEVLLYAVEYKEYVHRKAFDTLKKYVNSTSWAQSDDLSAMYRGYIQNLVAAEPIRTGKQPQSDSILEALFKDASILNFIQKMLRDNVHLDPEDILCESFKSFFENISAGKFGGGSTLKTYLIGICRNKINEIFSGKKSKLHFEELDEKTESKKWDGWKEPLEELGVDFTLGLIERNNISAQIVDKLNISEKCREALILRYQEEYSMAQAAAYLNIQIQSAKNIADRCRKQIHEAIFAVPTFRDFIKETRLFQGFFDENYIND